MNLDIDQLIQILAQIHDMAAHLNEAKDAIDASLRSLKLEENKYSRWLNDMREKKEVPSGTDEQLIALFQSNRLLRGLPKDFVVASLKAGLFQNQLNGKYSTGGARKMAAILSKYVGYKLQANDGSFFFLRCKENKNANSKTYSFEQITAAEPF